MNFLSLAPVASTSQQNVAKLATGVADLDTKEFMIQRANSTGSESSDTSTSSESVKQVRFLKLGHSDGDWSEEVIEA